jgi:hypothetical protein
MINDLHFCHARPRLFGVPHLHLWQVLHIHELLSSDPGTRLKIPTLFVP